MLPDIGLMNYVLDRSQGCRHITLIDPGKQSSEIADQNISESSDEDVSLDTMKEQETENSSKEETETSNS